MFGSYERTARAETGTFYGVQKSLFVVEQSEFLISKNIGASIQNAQLFGPVHYWIGPIILPLSVSPSVSPSVTSFSQNWLISWTPAKPDRSYGFKTSCKKSDKSLEPLLRKLGNRQTN